MAEQTRLEDERDRLHALARASRGAVELVEESPDLQRYVILLRVAAPVAAGTGYRVGTEHRLTLTLPDGFPEEKPLAAFDHTFFVPNVWPNGVPCILESWRGGQTLSTLVTEIIEEIQGIEPKLGSPANEAAGEKFKDAAFVAELRRRLGPPLRLAPPAPGLGAAGRAAGVIRTATIASAAGRQDAPPRQSPAIRRAVLRRAGVIRSAR